MSGVEELKKLIEEEKEEKAQARRAAAKRWYDKNKNNLPDSYKERRSATTKAWYQKNKEELRVRENQKAKQDRLRIIEQFGGKCVECGVADPIVLDFDHINDDRHIERTSGDTRRLEFVAQANPSRFQLLCKNCNWRKEYWRRQNDRNN